jgi:transposase
MCRHAIKPNLENGNEDEIRLAMKLAPSKRSYRWFQVIHFFGLGFSYQQVSESLLMSDRMIRRIVQLFNARGVDGLIEKKYRGRPKIIKQEKREELIKEFTKIDQTAPVWSIRKFHGHIREELGVEVSYNTVLRIIKESGFSLQVPRSWPVDQDEEKRRIFKEELAILVKDDNVDLWFGDEVGFEGNTKPRRAWYQKGSRPKVEKQCLRIRTNLCAMVKPSSGEFFSIEVPYMDQYVFQCFLDEANKFLASSKKQQVLILDNASWHKAQSLNWGLIRPIYLPPHSPDLNPIERAWLVIKNRFFNNFIARDIESLSQRVLTALTHFVESKIEVSSICAVHF